MSKTITCNDLKLLPFGLISEEITRAYNRNIERLKCSLAKNDFCDDIPGIYGLAVSQFCPLKDDNTTEIDFSAGDMQFTFGSTEYSVDPNDVPAGVTVDVNSDGTGLVTVDPNVYNGPPIIEIPHTITADDGTESTAANYIALPALSAFAHSTPGEPIPEPEPEEHCCVGGSCVPTRIINDPALNPFGLSCDNAARYPDAESCADCGEPGLCCIPGDEDGLTAMLRGDCDAAGGIWWPIEQFGEAAQSCKDIWCCYEEDDVIDCEPMKQFECDERGGESHPDQQKCEQICETRWCCNPAEGCYRSTEDDCDELDRREFKLRIDCEEFCGTEWCCDGFTCNQVFAGSCSTGDSFVTLTDCEDFCEKVFCCTPENPFDPTGERKCVETIKGKCFDDHYPTPEECEDNCGDLEDCCCLEISSASVDDVEGGTITASGSNGGANLTISADWPEFFCEGTSRAATLSWSATVSSGEGFVHVIAPGDSGGEDFELEGSITFDAVCGPSNGGANQGIVNFATVSVFEQLPDGSTTDPIGGGIRADYSQEACEE